jgi:hypothetical protein
MKTEPNRTQHSGLNPAAARSDLRIRQKAKDSHPRLPGNKLEGMIMLLNGRNNPVILR